MAKYVTLPTLQLLGQSSPSLRNMHQSVHMERHCDFQASVRGL